MKNKEKISGGESFLDLVKKGKLKEILNSLETKKVKLDDSLSEKLKSLIGLKEDSIESLVSSLKNRLEKGEKVSGLKLREFLKNFDLKIKISEETLDFVVEDFEEKKEEVKKLLNGKNLEVEFEEERSYLEIKKGNLIIKEGKKEIGKIWLELVTEDFYLSKN